VVRRRFPAVLSAPALPAVLTALAAVAAALLAAPGPPAAAADAPAPLLRAADPVPGQYIVTLDPDTAPQTALTRAAPGVEPLFTYDAVLHGFAARLTDEQLAAVRAAPGVRAVEEDGVAATAAAPPSWGLDRIDQAALPLDQRFDVTATGAGATVYVIDTGIDYDHEEFGGRAVPGYDAVRDGQTGRDCAGHGTHVAGTAAGETFGVAPDAALVSVRVLDCEGAGTWSGVIAGFEWVAENARRPAVANASLGGESVQAVDDAADALAEAGVLPVVAAGNEATDACQVSPARAEHVVTVGATDANDAQTDFSNDGACLELYAPGQDIVSAKLGGGTTTLSGTSMAAPHVAGVAALHLAGHPDATPGEVAAWLTEQATPDVLRVAEGSPNRLLYTAGL
jgi:subtilisin family serine protease